MTSIDCFALVGQPKPQYPRFQQALTLRGTTAVAIPSFSAPRFKTALFSFGGNDHGATWSRRSIIENHGASASEV